MRWTSEKILISLGSNINTNILCVFAPLRLHFMNNPGEKRCPCFFSTRAAEYIAETMAHAKKSRKEEERQKFSVQQISGKTIAAILKTPGFMALLPIELINGVRSLFT